MKGKKRKKAKNVNEENDKKNLKKGIEKATRKNRISSHSSKNVKSLQEKTDIKFKRNIISREISLIYSKN